MPSFIGGKDRSIKNTSKKRKRLTPGLKKENRWVFGRLASRGGGGSKDIAHSRGGGQHNVESPWARPTIAAKWRLRAGTPFVSL